MAETNRQACGLGDCQQLLCGGSYMTTAIEAGQVVGGDRRGKQD